MEQGSLLTSASSGNTDEVKRLVALRCDINIADQSGRTPVMLAVIGNHLDTAVQLALSGADLARCDPHGRTALHHSILANNREVSARSPHVFSAKGSFLQLGRSFCFAVVAWRSTVRLPISRYGAPLSPCRRPWLSC